MLMSSDGPWHDDRGVVNQRAQAVLPGLVSDLRGGRRDAAHRTPVLLPSRSSPVTRGGTWPPKDTTLTTPWGEVEPYGEPHRVLS